MFKDAEKKYDIRVVKKYIQEGLLTRKEYEAYLEKLPDATSKIDDEYHFTFPPARKKRTWGLLPQPNKQNAPSPENEREE